MFTTDNYYSAASSLQFATMPETLRKGHEFIEKATSGGADWSAYHAKEGIKKMIDLYFSKLAEYVGKNTTPKPPNDTHLPPRGGRGSRGKRSSRGDSSPKPPRTSAAKPGNAPNLVPRVTEEVRFIQRFVALNNKSKTKEQVLAFLNGLQKAIVEKRIRKTSPYAEQIRYIQDRLLETYNSMKATVRFEMKPETYEAYKQIGGSEKALASVAFIKRYISMNEKTGMKERARKLLTQVNNAYRQDRIGDGDPYAGEMQEVKKNLEAFISDKGIKVLEIEKAVLNGLEGILGCACQNLSGLDSLPKPTVMNSMDFANLHFSTIGLQGKWRDFIGDPSTNFTAMVYGKPKMGKSYLCMDFAGYLARNHGRVLYVAKEEGLDKTLQDKLNDKAVKHPNLDVASILPASLARYDFIFLDSVNKLGLKPEDLNRLKAMYPSKSFVYVFQSTKEGNFRGENSFQHDVDVVIEVPEIGRAVQYGRFNQGGEMRIF